MTVQQGKHTTVLEMEFCVLDFCLVTDSVYRSDYADPESVLVLLTNDLVRGTGKGLKLDMLLGCDRLQVYRSSQPREPLCNGLPGAATTHHSKLATPLKTL